MEDVEFRIDKRVLLFRLVASVLMTGLCFVVLALSLSNDVELFAPNLLTDFFVPFLSVISLIGIFFFSLAFFFTLKMWMFRIPVLTIQDAGIIDNSSALSADFIPFDSIETVYTKRFITDTYICVQLKNEKEFLAKLFFLKRWVWLANKKLGFEAVLIQLFPSFSSSEIEDIARLIRDRQDFHKQKRKILLKEE